MGMLNDVKTILGNGSTIYIGDMPASPDNVIGLFHTGGYARSLNDTPFEQPTFQVRVRNTSYATGETMCNTVKDALHKYVGGDFMLIVQMGDIQSIGRDENQRHEWTINFQCYYARG